MKKLLFLLLTIGGLSLNATIHHIGVDGCSFNPSVKTIMLGDTIHWFWDAASPRRSSSMNIPSGATAWDVLLDGTQKDYYYVPAVPGQYYYKSNILPTCIASFNVNGPTQIGTIGQEQNVCAFFPNPVKSTFLLIHPKNATSIELFNIEGKKVLEAELDPKETNDEITLNGLKPGNYVVNVKQKRSTIYTSKLIVAE